MAKYDKKIFDSSNLRDLISSKNNLDVIEDVIDNLLQRRDNEKAKGNQQLADELDKNISKLISDKYVTESKAIRNAKKLEAKFNVKLTKEVIENGKIVYEKDENGNDKLDKNGNKIPRLEIDTDAFDKLSEAAEKLEESSKSLSRLSSFMNASNRIVQAGIRLATIELGDKEYEKRSAKFDVMMADINAAGKIATAATDLQASAYVSAVTSSLGAWTNGLNEAAYASASKLIDLSAKREKFNLTKSQIDLEKANAKSLRMAQNTATLNNLTAEQWKAGADIAAETVKLVGKGLSNVEMFGFSTGNAPEVGGEIIANVAETAAGINSTITEWTGKLNVQQVENQNKLSEALLSFTNELKKTLIDAGAEVAKAWLDFAQKTEQRIEKSELAANNMGVGLGYSGTQLEDYKKSMFETQVTISKWGKTLEDAKNIQNTYAETTTRNIQLSDNDMDTSFALDKLIGKDGASVELTASMELFKHSISDSNEMFGEMFREVNRIGLSGRKYLNDLTRNLKLAEKYQFKGGTKGLMEMAKWAQNVRFNMESLSGMIDKIQTGGLEGIINESASLQVLGGNFAMGADPLAMAYESYSDPEGLARRMNGMLKGIGVVNSTNGEVVFSPSDQIRMRGMANATGQSYDDIMKQARQNAYGATISRNLNGNFNWDDSQKALVTNKAQMRNGEWTVTMSNGEEKSVSDLTPDDLRNLMPEGQEEIGEDLVKYAAGILSAVERIASTEHERDAELMRGTRDKAIEEWNERIENTKKDIEDNLEEYAGIIKEGMGVATASQETLRGMMEIGNQNVQDASSEIIKEGENIAESLGQVNTILQEALEKMNIEFNVSGEESANGENGNANGGNKPYKLKGGDVISQKEYELLKEASNNDSYVDELLSKTDDGNYRLNNKKRNYVSKNGTSQELGAADYLNRIIGEKHLGANLNDMHQKAIEEKRQEIIDNEYAYYLLNNCSGWYYGGVDEKKAISAKEWFQREWLPEHPNEHLKGPTFDKNNVPGKYTGTYDVHTTNEKSRSNREYISSVGGIDNIELQDGYVAQNGNVAKISSQDQIIAAKEDGPVDEMFSTANNILDMYKNMSSSHSIASGHYMGQGAYAKMPYGAGDDNPAGMSAALPQAGQVTPPIGGGASGDITSVSQWHYMGQGAYAKMPYGAGDDNPAGMSAALPRAGQVTPPIGGGASGDITNASPWHYMGQGAYAKMPYGAGDDNPAGMSAALPRAGQVTPPIGGGASGDITSVSQWHYMEPGAYAKMPYGAGDDNPAGMNITPMPMPYDSFVKESPYSRGFTNNDDNKGDEIKIAPIQINFNGSIRLDGVNGSMDITEMIARDPNFIRSLSQMLSQEVEKKLNGGRSRAPYKPI